MNNTFENKTIIITGGSSGIGKETTLAFLQAGARVMINGRREHVLQDTTNELDPTGKQLAYVAGDISQKQTVEELVRKTVAQFGSVDVLSNHPRQPDNELANQQIKQLIEDNIDKLPEAFRSVFMLRAIEQCSVRETAEILEIQEATVKTRFHRANTLLQAQLNQHIEKVGLSVHEFAGARCDSIVRNVMQRISDIS